MRRRVRYVDIGSDCGAPVELPAADSRATDVPSNRIVESEIRSSD
jgi:hypothetical protein